MIQSTLLAFVLGCIGVVLLFAAAGLCVTAWATGKRGWMEMEE